MQQDEAQEWIDRVRMPGYKTVIERVFVIHVEAYDWTCPEHIAPRYTAEEIRDAIHATEERLRSLEIRMNGYTERLRSCEKSRAMLP
jgi:hypothetical protein